MRRGFLRLGVFITCVWLALVIATVLYQYLHANPFCQFDARTVWKSTCQGYFWSWMPVGKLAKLSPHIVRMLLASLAPPAIGWLLGLGTSWVIKGFRVHAT